MREDEFFETLVLYLVGLRGRSGARARWVRYVLYRLGFTDLDSKRVAWILRRLKARGKVESRRRKWFLRDLARGRGA